MVFSVATWNINSVRLRKEMVLDYLKEANIDVLCLQETKCPDTLFPLKDFQEAGYEFVAINGQKGYNGVAFISRIPFSNVQKHTFCAKNDSRHISASFLCGQQKVTIHNFYVPAGGDIPDRTLNEKFGHKLDFLEEMQNFCTNHQENTLILGDLNIAPLTHDVWSHKQLLQVVSHTEIERKMLIKLQKDNDYVDIMREKWPEPVKLYSWWSYRAKDWKKSNRGRRLDHIWSSKDIAGCVENITIHKKQRGLDRPSDHVPISAVFAF